MIYKPRLYLPFLIALLVPLFLFFMTPLASAATFMTGDDSSVQAGEVFDDDLYIFGDLVNIDGTVNGDVVAFGSDVNINGTVTGSVLVFAQTIRINGNVEGSVRGGANNVYFQGQTGRDLIMAANTINVAGEVGNDFFSAASSGTVTAAIGRNIMASMNRLVIDAPVGGDINATVSELVLGSSARVEGEVSYTSESDALVDDQAVILGPLNRLEPPADKDFRAFSAGRSAWNFIRPILSLLAVTLLMVLLFPKFTAGVAARIGEQPGPSVGFGALIVFVAPLAALIILITVIGLPISFLSMLLYIVLIYLTRIFAGYFLARLALEKFGKELHPVWTALIGVLVLALLIKIPFVGWLIHLAAVLFAAGAFILYMVGEKTGTAQKALDGAEA